MAEGTDEVKEAPQAEAGDIDALANGGEVLEAKPADSAAAEADVQEVSRAEEELRGELRKVNDRYLRMAADFDNFRKRQAKERQDVVAYANETLVLDILPVLDNLERALSAAGREPGEGTSGVLKGVELTMRMFQQVLSRNGVERVKAVGEKFDPHRHEAIAKVETGDKPADTVLEEAEAGYTLNGRVIRPAKVKVARPPSPAPESAEEAKETEAKEEQDA